MAERDTVDFVAAVAIGAVLGAAAALLLRPDRPTARQRLARRIEPVRKGAGKRARRARKGAEAAIERGGDALAGGRDAAAELRREVAGIVASAREDLAKAVAEQVGDLETALKRLRRS